VVDRQLLGDDDLHASAVVANCSMNRERQLAGVNSYTRELVSSPVCAWTPSRSFDLITCVHGLHYVGDKLAALARAASWLTPRGLLVADLDLAGISIAGQPAGRRLSRALRDAGFSYDFRRHRISRTGKLDAALPYRYLGADDRAGPNYTGQPAVTSHYE